MSGQQPEVWTQALDALQGRIKPANFDMWLRPIECETLDGSRLVLRAPNRYIKDWFETHYLEVVLHELSALTQQSYQVHFQPCTETGEVAQPPTTPPTETPAAPRADFSELEQLNDRYSFESFVVGPSNQLAHAASKAVAEMPAAKYNPLFICGGVGLGKTHLLSAAGHAILHSRPAFRVIYRSSEQFMNDYINHLRSNRMEEFRRRYRQNCDVLLIDDIQFIAGKSGTQDEFFHTFNALYDLNRQIIVTSDKYPHEIPDLEERLRTRFQWGLIADIQQPEMETRVAILKRKAEQERIALSDDVALFMATHIKSNVRELEGSLIRVAAAASIQEREITIEFAQDALRSFFSPAQSGLSVEMIQKEVAAYFDLKVADIKGAKRHKAVARPRQIAMYLARKLTPASFPDIGQRFGGKDHSTVISACNKIADLLEKDLSIRTTVETIERQLNL